MNLQFNLSRTWLWLITLAVALIITGVIAFCWINASRAVRYQADAQRYQADTQRYYLIQSGTAHWGYLLDRRTGKTLLRVRPVAEDSVLFRDQTVDRPAE